MTLDISCISDEELFLPDVVADLLLTDADLLLTDADLLLPYGDADLLLTDADFLELSFNNSIIAFKNVSIFSLFNFIYNLF